MTNRSKEYFRDTLFTSPYCLVHPINSTYGGLTTDHLFPKSIAKQYPKLFNGLLQDDNGRLVEGVREAPENKVRLCAVCHRRIDHNRQLGKFFTIERFGLVGLVKFIAEYPRSPRAELLDMQSMQWQLLFNRIATRILILRSQDQIPETEKELMKNVEGDLNYHLYRWEQGNFRSRLLPHYGEIGIPDMRSVEQTEQLHRLGTVC